MSTSLFKITPTPPTTIQVAPGDEGKLSFTVESLAAPDKVHEILLQALLVGEEGKGKEVDWLVAGLVAGRVARPERTLRMVGGQTATVAITVRPTAATPRGSHTLKLVIADKERPNDVYTESPAVACEVLAPAGAPPPGKRRPWWLIPLIAGGGLLVVGGGVLLIFLLARGAPAPAGLGEACGERGDGAACDEGLACAADVSRCLLIGGAACELERAALCASSECDATLEVCTVPPGAACDPGDKDRVPCRSNSVCDPASNRCLGIVGAACRDGAECETGKCDGGACAVEGPAVAAGDPCEGSCPAPLQCSATTHRCVEQLGRPCSNDNQCASGLCEGDACARPELLRNCTADGVCDVDQKCVEVQPGLKRCKWQPGHACTGDGECSSKLGCNRGICARDDGKCVNQSDCPPPYQCIAAKQTCLKPNGQLCGGNAECDSTFCHDNRCAPSPCVPACGPGRYCNNNPADPRCLKLFVIPRDINIPRDVFVPRDMLFPR